MRLTVVDGALGSYRTRLGGVIGVEEQRPIPPPDPPRSGILIHYWGTRNGTGPHEDNFGVRPQESSSQS